MGSDLVGPAARRVAIVGTGEIASQGFEAARKSSHNIVAPADADQVLVTGDDPATVLELTRAVRAAAPRALATVLLEDFRAAQDAATAIDDPRTRVLSVAALAARAVHVDHPPFLRAKEAGHGRVHALIVGFGQAGQAIAHDLIVNGRTTYLAAPRITVIDPEAPAREAALRARAPELDRCAEIAFVEGRVGADGVGPDRDRLLRAIAEGGPVTAVYVCRGADAANLGAAETLLRLSDLGDPPIFTRLRGAANGAGLPEALIPFGDLRAAVAASEFLCPAPDEAARAFSEAYRATLPEAQRNDPANRSARPWDQLDETYRQATRDAVAHIPAKLASAAVDASLWRGVAGPPPLPRNVRLFHDDAGREALAALEHERWNAQRRLAGWRWADIPTKDEARRLHPALVPYGDLSEAVKAYDRALVEETQAVCWAAADAKV